MVHEERLLEDELRRIRDVRSGPDGLIYLLTDEDDGRLVCLIPASWTAAPCCRSPLTSNCKTKNWNGSRSAHRVPGGQNVNKVSSALHLRFDIAASSLDDALKQRC